VLTSHAAVVAYCRTTMAWRDVEHVRALYLDNANALIEDVKLGEGTTTQVAVYPREVARRGLALNATGLILVHNHPAGDPTPSDADIDMTKRVKVACDAVGIRFYDHLIIGKGAETSMHEKGLMW
jgi:DNA repair protein RadC